MASSTPPEATTHADEAFIAGIVAEVVRRLSASAATDRSRRPAVPLGAPRHGVYEDVGEAVAAARAAQHRLQAATLSVRARVIESLRKVLRRDREALARLEFDETRIGRLPHKLEKLEVAAGVPGLEMLGTEATSGDHGLTVTEHAPFGVIGVVTPITHSVPTLGCNAIMMLAAGNTLVCNPHPGAAASAVEATRRFNREIQAATGIEDTVCTIASPSLETAGALFRHPGIDLLCVTGGSSVARAALASGRRAIAAGPGNPPVVVDETADIEKAAAAIVRGAAYDNNLLCIGEKEVLVVAAVSDKLMAAMERQAAYRLSRDQLDRLAVEVLVREGADGPIHPRKEFVGRDAAVVAGAIGLEIAPEVPLLFGEVDRSSPFLPCEQMMPVLPVLACRDVPEAIEQAVALEHGFKHTAMMWSRNVENLTAMGRACEATLYVKNGASVAGLGRGGQGHASFSIATTGEGITSPATFTRIRRCVMVDSLRIF